MYTHICENVQITHPSAEILQWCKDCLEMPNPEYAKKKRMGFSTYRTPQKLVLYEVDGDVLSVPYGCRNEMIDLTTGFLYADQPRTECEYDAVIPLYDYQEKAVNAVLSDNYGILQSPAGSGKTQMGIALAVRLGRKALWITHTKDLLTQSYERAKQYIDPSLLGKITEGKVQIGSGITFATVQTLSNLDLSRYRNTWDTIIVDECHRVAGSPTSVTRFYKVLSSLNAPYKYGLSATVHRADGLIKATHALLGPVVYRVPDEAVKATVMSVTVVPIMTKIITNPEMLNGDGTLNYQKCISYLTRNSDRNWVIVRHLLSQYEHFNLILSERVEHLKVLSRYLKLHLVDECVEVLTGSTPKRKRDEILERARAGEIHFLLSTYALAKEGLDIPRLDRLHLTTPQKDYAVVVQAVGRVARRFPDKEEAVVYDYVDSTRWHERAWKTRCRHYRKAGCQFE